MTECQLLLHHSIKRKKFRTKLTRKYGAEILTDFTLLKTKHFWTLSNIASKYGFTQERARQIYNKLFSIPYKKIKHQLKQERDSQLNQMACAYDPRHKVGSYKGGLTKVGAEIELLVFNKCKELRLPVKIPMTTDYDLIINDHRVDVKSARIPSLIGSKGHTRYFRFTITHRQFDACEFFICYPIPKATFYIIPRFTLKSKGIYIREYDNNQHFPMPHLSRNNTNYREYKEAWHLLTQPKEKP